MARVKVAAARLTGARRYALVLLAAAALLLVLPATPAAAHANLLSTNPSDGAVVARSTTQVSLTFNEPVKPIETAFQLFDRAGTRRDLTASVVDSVVNVQLPGDLRYGSYVVSWRVISDDSHPIAGGLTFAVGTADGPAGSVPGATGAPENGPIRWLYLAAQIVGYLGLMTCIGLTVFEVAIARSSRLARHIRERVSTAGAGAAIIAYTLLVPLTQVREDGTGFGELTRPDTFSAGLSTAAGLTLALVVVGCAAMLLTPVLTSSRLRVGVAAVGVALAVGSVLPVGHTRTFGPPWLVMSSDVIHVAAASVWFGGLIGLGIFLAYARRAEGDPEEAALVMARFSGIAGGLVVALTVTGTILAVVIVGSVGNLVGTTYGLALLAKLALASVIGLLALWNRSFLVAAVRKVVTPPEQWRRLISAIIDEAVILVAVIFVTGFLTMQSPEPPAAPLAPAPQQAVSGPFKVNLGERTIQGTIDPGRTGMNTMELDLREADGKPFAPVEAPEVTASLPSAGLGPIEGTVERSGRMGHFRVLVSLPIEGAWQVTISVRLTQVSKPNVVVPVKVGP